MINPVCPLSDKEKLKTTLQHHCEYYQFYRLRLEPCKSCSYANWRLHFPKLIANDVFGVQPMSAPTGLMFNLKYKYNGEEK